LTVGSALVSGPVQDGALGHRYRPHPYTFSEDPTCADLQGLEYGRRLRGQL
jgi:hypothetical protein